ncbi:MAG: hypothetical protein AB8G96_06940 [Phycisphaerales bacterium]
MQRSTTNVLVSGVLLPGVLASCIAGAAMASGGGDVTVIRSTSGERANLTAAVDAVRNSLGEFNAPEPGSKADGRRQIDWDAAPDAVSAPNDFPPDFFNFPAFPRARGVVFTTPGTGFQLSATEASGTGIDFSNIDFSYEDTFESFSPERLFTPIGDNRLDITFKVPGVDRPALSHGFGAVFSDVDFDEVTSMEFYGPSGESLGLWYVDAGIQWGADETFSLLMVQFDEPIVSRVRVVLGTDALAHGVKDGVDGVDLVVMDDLIFGEPVPAAPILGDLNNDGLITIEDLLAVLAAFGPCDGCPEDFNNDGYVGIYDIVTILAGFDSFG